MIALIAMAIANPCHVRSHDLDQPVNLAAQRGRLTQEQAATAIPELPGAGLHAALRPASRWIRLGVMEPVTNQPVHFTYLRISQDRDETRRSVSNQAREVTSLAERLGARVSGDPFIDNDISATRSRTRPGYDHLVTAIHATAGPVVVLVWAVDRLYRRPRELEALIDLVETHPITITTAIGGAFDLNTSQGRLFARQLVAFAAFETELKADRQRVAYTDLAAHGHWHGPRRFGYRLTGNGTAQPDPLEAPVVRLLATRFLAGETLYSLTRWLNDTHVKPLRAERWAPTTVRQLLAAPRIAGLRAYTPTNTNHTENIFRSHATLTPGRWAPIITIAERNQIIAALTLPVHRPRAGKNLLTGLATCGRCGASLIIARSARGSTPGVARRRYVCKKTLAFPDRGGISIEAGSLETFISETAIARMSTTAPRPQTTESGDTAPGVPSDTAALWKDITEARSRIENLAHLFGAGELTLAEYRPARDAARAQAADAGRQLAAATHSAALALVPLGDPNRVRAWWSDAATGQRRAILEALIQDLVIHPAPKSGRTMDPDRVHITWRP